MRSKSSKQLCACAQAVVFAIKFAPVTNQFYLPIGG